ncbi:hypothetical protein, partial [uncultured Senegalimassilia sp.]|uniref:hypothetical protein n=1 Tax=uncultured Senegalimassilia sp. TaxID=1714350 RepID=UPI0026DFA75D
EQARFRLPPLKARMYFTPSLPAWQAPIFEMWRSSYFAHKQIFYEHLFVLLEFQVHRIKSLRYSCLMLSSFALVPHPLLSEFFCIQPCSSFQTSLISILIPSVLFSFAA